MKLLNTLFDGLIIAGIVLIDIGLFYLFIKAGIPYQDPPLEMQIEYAVNTGIGEAAFKMGLVIGCIGGIARIISAVVQSRRKG